MIRELIFSKIEKFNDPSTILFRSIEIKLLKERFDTLFANKKILDLGCGNGLVASTLFENLVDYGLDINQKALEEAGQKNIYKNLILADASKGIPLETESIDLIFSNCTIEHIKNLKPTLREISRVLKESGFFLFTVPSPLFKEYSVFSKLKLKPLVWLYGGQRDAKLQHYHCYSRRQWADFLAEFNLEIAEYYYYIDKKTLEFWDFLLFLNFPFRLLRKINGRLTEYFWQVYLRPKIFQGFTRSESYSDKGTALCVLAKKPNKSQNGKN